MGEMADLALDQMFDEDEFGLCGMDNISVDPDTHEVFTAGHRSNSITCRNCKAGGLHWGMHEDKWRLWSGDNLHKCNVKPLPEHTV